MATLLMHVFGNMSLNRTIFPPHLYIYDNTLVYKKGHFFSHDEITIAYNHISWAKIHRIWIFFAHLEIVSTGMQKVIIKWIKKKDAIKAKQLIDQKIYNAHKKDIKEPNIKNDREVVDFELSLKRLQELVNIGKISKSEYEKKRKDLLKNNYR